jgi:phospholipid/cholesterol/gamma-HCH transport system permease protein
MVGKETVKAFESSGEMIAFLGDATLAFARLLRGKARFRRADLVEIIQECGANALPIVTLISVLIGLILAFVGAVQLKQFGAQIYVADLVGIAMAREMGAIMTAIIMAGRTGAAFAAQLGTMQVNEEIDALSTLGLSPMDFLVLPRMLALILMMPLLCIYADLMGILGGAVVGIAMLDLTPVEYFVETQSVVRRDRRDFRLHARHPVRSQRLGGRTGRHLGRGHRHRLDHRDRRDPRGRDRHHRHMSEGTR